MVFGLSKKSESATEVKFRSRDAAHKLEEHALSTGSVLLIGHGIMNRLIANELQLNLWKGSSNLGKKYWEYAIYEK